jgi:RNA polymerase sigma-70 factor (ECF subfamily)
VSEAARRVERAAREEHGRLLAFLLARGTPFAAAEDALAEAFAAALAHWPREGIPARPEAWLLAVARNRLRDGHRRAATAAAAVPALEAMRAADLPAPDEAAAIPDHRLALLLACAAPAVEIAARAPLMLQCVLGLDAARIASAFLVAPAAMSQRLVRAKRRLGVAGARFDLPGADALAGRLPAVLEAIYAAYAAGANDPSDGGALAGEAAWLARLCAALAPAAPEALGLAALLLHLEARRGAARDAAGRYVPLSAQDPAAWDDRLQAEAEALLRQAAALGRPGRFQWEAAVQSAHAARRWTGRTDWDAILLLYDALLAATGSPVVAVNRAVALAEMAGAAAGLAALRAVAGDARLAEYQPFWAALAALAERAGEAAEAGRARQRAAGLATDPALRAFLLAERTSFFTIS